MEKTKKKCPKCGRELMKNPEPEKELYSYYDYWCSRCNVYMGEYDTK